MRAALIALAVGASVGAGAAVWAMQARHTADISELKALHAMEKAAQADAALFKMQEQERAKDEAVKSAEKRAAENKAAADLARAAADRLRGEVRDMPARIAAASRDAVNHYAATAGELLADCSAEYQRMAVEAAGHATDSRLMQEAWPR